MSSLIKASKRYLKKTKSSDSETSSDSPQSSSPQIVTCKGQLIIDVEGPLPLKLGPNLCKSLAGYISLTIVTCCPLLKGAGPYLLGAFLSELKGNLPLFGSPSTSQVLRTLCTISPSFYTAGSCVSGSFLDELIPFNSTWELHLGLSYPLVIVVSGQLKVTTDLIKNKDRLRTAGLSPLPYPLLKVAAKWRTLEHEFKHSKDITLALEAAYPKTLLSSEISRVNRG